jgi:branched-chain amino acid transport system substrate-binding protein
MAEHPDESPSEVPRTPAEHGMEKQVETMATDKRHLKAATLALAVVALATAAGCSGSSSPSAGTNTTPSTGASTPAGPTGSTIMLGNIGTYSGVGSSSQGGYRQGLEVWEKATNAAGGINGHPVKIIFQDDAGNPTTALTAVQKMVNDNHIVALISPASATTSYMAYLNDKGIPVLTASGFYGVSPGLTLNASTSLTSYSKTEANIAKLAGKKSYVDMYCAEVTICKASDATQKAEAKKLGLKFTAISEAASATSYTAACLQLKSQGYEAVALNGFTDTDIRFAKDCVQQGYHPLWITVGTALTPAFLTTPALSGVVVSLLDFPWFVNDSPATKTFQDALAKYAPGIQQDKLNYSPNLSAAYAAGQVFLEAASKATDPTKVSDLMAGFATIKGNDFGGLTPPLTFGTPELLSNPKKYVQPQANCFFAIQAASGAWGKVTGFNSYSACVK